MLKLLFPLILCVTALCAGAAEHPFEGQWEAAWPCVSNAQMQCQDGQQDVFTLRLTVSSDRICGFHLATAHFGARVDEGDLLDGKATITGTVRGGHASVQFRSAWEATGTAALQLKNGQLAWKIVSQSEGRSWLPDTAVLTRKRTAPGIPPESCR